MDIDEYTKKETSYPNMHEAEQFLRNPKNPSVLQVIIEKKKRTLFINRDNGIIGIKIPQKRNKGLVFSSWDTISKVCYPQPEEERNEKLVRKYQSLAAKATFSNPYLRKVKAAVPGKSLYENGLTTGVPIEGEVITLEAIRKWCVDCTYSQFQKALKEKRQYRSGRFNFRGYDGTLWLETYQEGDNYMKPGDIHGGFSKERRNCLNGFYYLLINDSNFIGYDID